MGQTRAERVLLALLDNLDEPVGLTWREVQQLAELPGTAAAVRRSIGDARKLARSADLVIPEPTSAGGYRYRITDRWDDGGDPAVAAVKPSTDVTIRRVLSNVRRSLDDLRSIRDRVDGRTLDGREIRHVEVDLNLGAAALEAVALRLDPSPTR